MYISRWTHSIKEKLPSDVCTQGFMNLNISCHMPSFCVHALCWNGFQTPLYNWGRSRGASDHEASPWRRNSIHPSDKKTCFLLNNMEAPVRWKINIQAHGPLHEWGTEKNVSNVRGAKQQRLVIRTVTRDQTHQLVDLLGCYKKLDDSVPHTWIHECLGIYINRTVSKFTAQVMIICSIYQGVLTAVLYQPELPQPDLLKLWVRIPVLSGNPPHG